MPKKFKGENSRVTKAKALKAKARADKMAKIRAEEERLEAAEWRKGSNTRAEAKRKAAEEKRIAKEAARQLKLAQMKAEEEELAKMKKAKPSARKHFAPKGSKGKKSHQDAAAAHAHDVDAALGALSAMDIDSALDVLGASGAGHKEKKLDRHPERRMKSAYAAFAEKETKRIKEENPHLRQSQIKNRIYKLWKKSPENPMNQEHLAYNAKV